MASVSGKRKYIPQHSYRGKLQRDARLDNVRGFLIFLVVIGHFLLPLAEANTRLISGLIYVIYVFHMPCFALVSGFYAKTVYKNGVFRWGKAAQMLWLYFVYELILFFTEWMAYGFSGYFPDLLHESGAPWYLMSMTLWYLTIPLFRNFRGKTAMIVVPVLFVSVTFLKYLIQLGSFLSIDRTLTLLPFFYLGYFCSQNNLDNYLLSKYKQPVDIAAVIVLLVVLFGAKDLLMRFNLVVYGADYRRYLPELYPFAWLINLIWNAMALAVSLGLIGIMLNRRMFLLTALGRNTLQIYFLHRPVRDLLMYLGMYELISPFSRLQVLLLVLGSILLTIALGAGFISEWFRRLRTVFDPLLEKRGAL